MSNFKPGDWVEILTTGANGANVKRGEKYQVISGNTWGYDLKVRSNDGENDGAWHFDSIHVRLTKSSIETENEELNALFYKEPL